EQPEAMQHRGPPGQRSRQAGDHQGQDGRGHGVAQPRAKNRLHGRPLSFSCPEPLIPSTARRNLTTDHTEDTDRKTGWEVETPRHSDPLAGSRFSPALLNPPCPSMTDFSST